MSITPIQQPDLSYLVYQRIRQMILSGELKAGEKLPQERIAEQLGVSRMPLHKAFVMLEDEFLVESIPRRGIFIREHTVREIIEAFECREALEGMAARSAAENLSEDDINQLENLFLPYHDLDEIDEANYQKADQQFHQSIIKASGNRLILKLNHIGNVLIGTYPKGIILPLGESLEDHALIIQAFRSRDKDKAEKLIRLHSRKAICILQKELIIE